MVARALTRRLLRRAGEAAMGGGGSGSAPSTPVTSGLRFAFDASATDTLLSAASGSVVAGDADTVETILDANGGSYSMTQGTSSARATLDVDRINGRPALVFESNDIYAGGDIDWEESTYFLVAQRASGAAEMNWYSQTNPSFTEQQSIRSLSDSELSIRGGLTLAATGLDPTQPFVCSVLFRNNASWIRFNGVTVEFGDSGTRSATGPTSLGGLTGNANRFVDGWIAELLHYNRRMTSQEVGRVEQYLSSKYAIAVTPVNVPRLLTWRLPA